MTLETQYLQYKINHPDSEITYEEWLALHSNNLAKAIQDIEEPKKIIKDNVLNNTNEVL